VRAGISTGGRRSSDDGPVDGCKWRQPRSLWHGLATSSTPTERAVREHAAPAPRSVRSPSEPGDAAGLPPARGSRRPWNPGGPAARATALSLDEGTEETRTPSLLPPRRLFRSSIDTPSRRSSASPSLGSVPLVDPDGRVRVLFPALFPSLVGTDCSGCVPLSRTTVGTPPAPIAFRRAFSCHATFDELAVTVSIVLPRG